MNYSQRLIATLLAVFSTMQTAAMLPVSAKEVKVKGSSTGGHKFGFGWFKRGNHVHKNGYSKNYKNPKP